ncbi:hypothetical protein JY651_09690 [Pyxidicoccus parkwayensis]|uniref:Uncharacterized protein n=1 Tax=Pyxidicoccus parkwayensis TaxID=2813578 RepID=A0ABX7P3X2_9BACT|nr:hypothetical protein [Pyxidicoccus parkwaysis]QSQ25175.1 hypothetical protein JY651_09690 [Pyxidicoccus parkwaysis]
MPWQNEVTELGRKLESAIRDATTLTVNTLAGNVTATYANGAWTVTPGQQAQVIAQTEIRLDGDIDTVVPTANGTPSKEWMDIHSRSVQLATEGRAALLKSIAEIVKSFS